MLRHGADATIPDARLPEEAAPFMATRMVNRVLGTSYTVEYVERKMRADPLFLTIVDAIGAATAPETPAG